MMHWYKTPQILHKIGPRISLCWRCHQVEGTLLCIFWECPSLQNYWTAVNPMIHRVMGVSLPDDPMACLLHTTLMSIKYYQNPVFKHLLSAAKACIPAM